MNFFKKTLKDFLFYLFKIESSSEISSPEISTRPEISMRIDKKNSLGFIEFSEIVSIGPVGLKDNFFAKQIKMHLPVIGVIGGFFLSFSGFYNLGFFHRNNLFTYTYPQPAVMVPNDGFLQYSKKPNYVLTGSKLSDVTSKQAIEKTSKAMTVSLKSGSSSKSSQKIDNWRFAVSAGLNWDHSTIIEPAAQTLDVVFLQDSFSQIKQKLDLELTRTNLLLTKLQDLVAILEEMRVHANVSVQSSLDFIRTNLIVRNPQYENDPNFAVSLNQTARGSGYLLAFRHGNSRLVLNSNRLASLLQNADSPFSQSFIRNCAAVPELFYNFDNCISKAQRAILDISTRVSAQKLRLTRMDREYLTPALTTLQNIGPEKKLALQNTFVKKNFLPVASGNFYYRVHKNYCALLSVNSSRSVSIGVGKLWLVPLNHSKTINLISSVDYNVNAKFTSIGECSSHGFGWKATIGIGTYF